MADVSRETPLNTDWTEVTVPLSMADGTNYVLDIDGAETNATAYWAETDTNTPAPTVGGHPWIPFKPKGPETSRVYPKRTNRFFWVRLDRGTATLKATEAGI